MKVVNVITIYLWKTRETLYCLFFDCPSIELIRTERTIPRLKMSEKSGEKIDGVWHDSASLIVSITNSYGEYVEMNASLNLNSSSGDNMKARGSISIYDADLAPKIRDTLLHSEVKLLRYEIG